VREQLFGDMINVVLGRHLARREQPLKRCA